MLPVRHRPLPTRGARLRSCLALLAAVWLWLLLPGSAGARNPDVKWKTIETEHFYVHFWSGEEDAAERTAMIAEKAYAELSEAWGHDVYLKTHITLSDVQDTANGRATANPYPQVVAYATAPESGSVLEAYDDWLDILITHELVHVVHLDTVHGIARALNGVFGFGVLGKVTTPNIVQPRWIIEGVATMQETKYSAMGRLRSAQFDAFLRMAVLDGTFQSIDQVSNGARVFPHGTSVYLYGSHFMHYIMARYGEDKLRDLSHVYATQVIPYGINKAMEKVLGVTFYQLWKEFKLDTARRFKAQARRIRARGLRQGRRLTFGGETTRYPMWSRDDEWIYFYKGDGHRDEGFKRVRATGGRIREGVGIGRQGSDVDLQQVFDMEDPGAASFVAATGDIVFDQMGTYDLRYRWSDLWRWNGGDPRGAEQLTFGMRASEPDVSPDGRTVVFRRNDVAQSRLGFLDLDTGETQELPPIDRLSQVYTPRWNPDGMRVAFSGFVEGGYRDIYVFNRGTGTTQRITADRHIDMTPSWSPDGRYLLFVSDRDDVYNVYAWDTEAETLHQVSNVLGGALDPRVSHDGERLAYVGYGKNGYDAWVMDFDPKSWLPALPSVTDLPPAEDPKPPIAGNNGRALSLESHRYRPVETFYPRLFFPTALDFQSNDFGMGLGFETGITDYLAYHSALMFFNYNRDTQLASGAVSYTFDRLWPSFNITASRSFNTRSGGFTRFDYDRPLDSAVDNYVVNGYRERQTIMSVGTRLPVLRHAQHSANFGMEYVWRRWENLDEGDNAIDPNAPVTRLPEVGDAGEVGMSASYSNESDGGGRFSYGVEQGRSASVRVGVIDRRLGGDFGDINTSVSYNETIPMPWRGHQSLALRWRAGAAAGGFRNRGAFCVGDYVSGGDAIRSMLGRTGFGTSGCSLLRGYGVRALSGRYFARATAEYRIPLADVDRGVGSLPFFMTRVGVIPFVDVGNAWTDPTDVRDVLVGSGAALVFSFRMGYAEGINLFLKYAHGFMREFGTDTFRLVVSTNF
ncbi:MAG: hypothetical protein AAGA54_14090 [Myxococcota bacterium]